MCLLPGSGRQSGLGLDVITERFMPNTPTGTLDKDGVCMM